MGLSLWSIFALMTPPGLVTFHEEDNGPASSASGKVKA